MQIIIYTDNAKELSSTILNSTKSKTWVAKKDKKGFNIYYHSTPTKQWENEFFIKPYLDKESNEKLFFRVTKIDGED